MKGSAAHLLGFLEGSRKRFIIPVYQRNYDWKKENCQQLFDDLVSLIKQGKKTHFFGSIVSCTIFISKKQLKCRDVTPVASFLFKKSQNLQLS